MSNFHLLIKKVFINVDKLSLLTISFAVIFIFIHSVFFFQEHGVLYKHTFYKIITYTTAVAVMVVSHVF